MLRQRKILFFSIIGLALLLVTGTWLLGNGQDCTLAPNMPTISPIAKPNNATEISIIYAPEEDVYLQTAIHDFNCNYAKGIDPLTGAALAFSERPIYVTGRSGSSGTVQQGIINAFLAPNNANVERPTIFSPSVGFWLAMVNEATGQAVFDLNPEQSRPTALSAVVIAIWESRLQAIQQRNGNQPIGWADLLQVMRSPNGWNDYGISGRKTVYYGATNPYVSSTGLAALSSEFYASAAASGSYPDLKALTASMIDDPAVQQGVRDIEKMIKHYFERTTEFQEYIGQGPDYVDFVPLQEDALLGINLGLGQFKPPETLVAVYPKEGAFMFEHPFGIPNADWVTAEQRAAAHIFTDYVLNTQVQQQVLAKGLMRPANPQVTLGYPYVPALGVDPAQPQHILAAPPADVLVKIQTSWQYVKKQSDILLVMDTSGSMEGEPLQQAKDAAQLFMARLDDRTRIALLPFGTTASPPSPLLPVEQKRNELLAMNASLPASGDTALYDAVIQAVEFLQSTQDAEGQSQDRIQTIIVLSDGKDTSSTHTLYDITQLKLDQGNPIFIFPIAYGSGADIAMLNTLAQLSTTKVFSGDPAHIEAVFAALSSTQ